MLKYYKVDGDGKIERLRRECPQEGVSIFPIDYAFISAGTYKADS